MRPVLHGDIVAAARVLLRMPRDQRRSELWRMLKHADAADRYRKRLGKGHPKWGNGSLMAVAMGREMVGEPFLDDPEYCRCMVDVFEVLIMSRCEKSSFSRTRNLRRLAR